MQAQDKIKQYKRLLSTEDGKAVLADLFSRYGFDPEGVERPGFHPGQTHADLAWTEGMKEVIRYILRMRNMNPEAPGKTEKATNGISL
jgi:hypothetical protein